MVFGVCWPGGWPVCERRADKNACGWPPLTESAETRRPDRCPLPAQWGVLTRVRDEFAAVSFQGGTYASAPGCQGLNLSGSAGAPGGYFRSPHLAFSGPARIVGPVNHLVDPPAGLFVQNTMQDRSHQGSRGGAVAFHREPATANRPYEEEDPPCFFPKPPGVPDATGNALQAIMVFTGESSCAGEIAGWGDGRPRSMSTPGGAPVPATRSFRNPARLEVI